MPSVLKIPSIFTAIDKMSAPLRAMGRSVSSLAETSQVEIAKIERKFRSIEKTASNIAQKSAMVGTAIAVPLGLAVNSAVKFEDTLADVGKTTGLSGEKLAKFGKDILKMSVGTKTSIDDLAKIAEIGGQLGVAENELLGFTDSVNKFNVALGADFSGGVEQASADVGKLKTLFKDTRGIDIASAIQKSGSAINELGAIGAGTSENITDFTLRIGALPDALKPSLTNTLALGTYLEELGINSQIGAGGLSNVFLKAGEDIDAFGKQIGISSAEAKALLANDPTEFAKRLAGSFNGVAPDVLATKLKALGIGSQESIKVLGAMGSGLDRLTQLQKVSSNAFKEGTSLQAEYDKKNATTAANLAKAKNNMEAFSITVGTALLPVLNDLIAKVSPIIKGFSDWASQNPGLLSTIVKIAVVLAGLMFVVSAVSAGVAIFSTVMASYGTIVAIASFATQAWAIAMWIGLGPLALIVLGIAALIAAVIAVIFYWDEFGAAVLAVGGIILAFTSPVLAGFAAIVSVLASIWRNWDGIKTAFAEKGFIDGILMIGKVIFDAILMPIQQLLQLMAKLPGGVGKMAASAAEGIGSLRAGLGLNVGASAVAEQANQTALGPVTEAVNPEKERQSAMTEIIKSTSQTQNVNIGIKDQTGRATMSTDNNIVPISMSSTGTYGK